jgi:hypothetical protein
MNVFEDLIEELKEENLLESTVALTTPVVTQQPKATAPPNPPPPANAQPSFALNQNPQPKIKSLAEELSDQLDFVERPIPQTVTPPAPVVTPRVQNTTPSVAGKSAEIQKSIPPVAFPSLADLAAEFKEPDSPKQPIAIQNRAEKMEALNGNIDQELLEQISRIPIIEEPSATTEKDAGPKPATFVDTEVGAEFNSGGKSTVEDLPGFTLPPPVVDAEFFKRRATEEVTSLQIVEHILSAIEREQLKIVPKQYEDISVKKALHDFLQLAHDPLSPEHAKAEFKLMQETESWYSELSSRDKRINVGHLRRYCETAKPSLSAQALISLARFYRNAPFSETVRGKFDMVITRLMTREKGGDTREILLKRNELIKHLADLYSDWSSIPLYGSNEEDSDVLLGVLKFEDFAEEVQNADSLDELIRNDFFNRLKIYKENTGEKFFAPLLIATVIESNVLTGNKYVELVKREKEKGSASDIAAKYSQLLDDSVSDATSKTMQLAELLEEKQAVIEVVEAPVEVKQEKSVVEIGQQQHSKAFVEKEKRKGILGINKFLFFAAVLTFTLVGGLYVWLEFYAPAMKSSPSVRKVSLEGNPLREYFKTARINKETFFAVVEPTWNGLSKDVREDILKKTLNEGTEQGYTKIHLLDKEGKTIAFASAEGITFEK